MKNIFFFISPVNSALQRLSLIVALIALNYIGFAQSTCIKTPYTKQIQIVNPNNNIVENTGFELGNYAWSFASVYSSMATIVSDPTNSANHCVQAVSMDAAAGDVLITQGTPNLTAGVTYTMSASLRSNHAVNPDININLQVRFNYPGGSSVTIPVLFYPTTTWTKYSFSFTVPVDSDVQNTLVQAYIYRGQTDTVFIDSIAVDDSNLATNSDFETGLTPWTVNPSPSRVQLCNYGCLGSYHCIKLTSLDNASGDALLSETIPNLSLGQTYRASAYMRSTHAVPTASAAANIQIRINYTNGSQFIVDTLIKPDSVWRLYTFNFTVPDTQNVSVSLAQIYYYRGNYDSVYVDNFEVNNSGAIYNMVNTSYPHPPTGPFSENFKGTPGQQLSFDNWLVVRKNWGSPNNGVVPDNIELVDGGGIKFHGHGDLYDGPIKGSDSIIGNGKNRVGSCIATKNYYASGEYDVVAKVTPGFINAFWNFHYIQDTSYQSGGIKNTEIDYEFPGAPSTDPYYTGYKSIIADMNLNTWGGLCDGDGFDTSVRWSNLPKIFSDTFHKFTIIWHSGGGGISPSVQWYVDGTLARIITDTLFVPFRAARFWLGVWYAGDIWMDGDSTSLLQYSDTSMEVQSVTITPFYEPNDVYENETDPAVGYVTPQYIGSYPTFPSPDGRHSAPGSSGIANATATNTAEDITVNVNPMAQQVQLSIINGNGDYITEANLLNMNGQIINNIYFYPNQSIVTINLSNYFYSSGIYLLQCTTQNGHIIYKKVTLYK